MTSHKDKVQQFWNERADYGMDAGSNDFLLKELEERALIERVPSGSRVLDIGCGNGATLIRLAEERACSGIGIDYADRLLDLASRASADKRVAGRVKFQKGDVMTLSSMTERFSYALTQRCLINLETRDEQERGFENVLSMLAPGGRYYMIEAFNDGNRALNDLREPLGLEPMTTPWHNRFFELRDVLEWERKKLAVVEEVAHFASTYYFLSRVVYAKLAADKGEQLRYDSEINLLSLRLPPIGEFGATKLVVWRKAQ